MTRFSTRTVVALEDVRTLKDEEIDDEIRTVAEEVSWLLHGATGEGAPEVTALLKQASQIKDKSDFDRQKGSLEKKARDIAAAEKLQVLGHTLEKGMAELLSNPRLHTAIQIQIGLAASAQPSKKGKT